MRSDPEMSPGLTLKVKRLVRVPVISCGLALSLASSIVMAGQADPLLKLTSPQAAATLVIEDLGSQIRSITESPLAAGLRKLPPVEKWLNSEEFKTLQRSKTELEAALGQGEIGPLLESLLGDAVVLSLEVPPGSGLDDARGLLLIKARDRQRLEAAIAALNRSETKSRQLRKVEERRYLDVPYFARQFQPESRKSDYYVVFDDGRLAWSDNEKAIQSVLDRNSKPASGLLDLKRFADVRSSLPQKMLISLYLDPTVLTPLLANVTPPQDPQGERLAKMLGRYLDAGIYAGLGAEWREGIHLHFHQTLDSKKLDPWQKRFMARRGTGNDLVKKAPPGAVALVSGFLDFDAIREAVIDLMGEADTAKFANLALGLRGLLLGLDPGHDVLPKLGPVVLAYLEDPVDTKSVTKPTYVGVLGLTESSPIEGRKLAGALENTIRTLMAFRALDLSGQSNPVRVQTTVKGEATLISFVGIAPSVAFALSENYVAVATSVEALGEFVNGTEGLEGPLHRLRSKYFSESRNYACLDTIAFIQMTKRYRASWGVSAQDFDAALKILDLFTGAYATVLMSEDATSIHFTLGVVSDPQ